MAQAGYFVAAGNWNHEDSKLQHMEEWKDYRKRSLKGGQAMYEKFGEFDSAGELNAAAEGLRKEGDTESLFALAEENGIDKEDVQDYIDGLAGEFVTPMMAAYGKLEMEGRELAGWKNPMEKMAVLVILAMLRGMCSEEGMAAAVMRKGKRVQKIFQAMRSGAERHKNGNIGISCGTDRELCEIIRAYYMESDPAFRERIEALYR